MPIALNEKVQDALEYLQREKDANRARRYKGSIPTDSVKITTSPSLTEDLSTLTSCWPSAVFQKKRGKKSFFIVL
jgi:hypothetical protein